MSLQDKALKMTDAMKGTGVAARELWLPYPGISMVKVPSPPSPSKIVSRVQFTILRM